VNIAALVPFTTRPSAPAHPAVPAFEQTFRRTWGERWLMPAIVWIPPLLVLNCLVIGVLMMPVEPWLGVPVILLGLALGVLIPVTVREMRGRFALRIDIRGGTLEMRLPAARGMAMLEPVETRLALSQIRRIDTRVEAYKSAGMIALQRAWSVELKDGSRIELGADRAPLKPLFERVARELALRTGAAIYDLGMVDAKSSGAAGLIGAKAPAWHARTLDADTVKRRLRGAARVGQLLLIAAIVLHLAKLLLAVAGVWN
jgi:hypothetical protein